MRAGRHAVNQRSVDGGLPPCPGWLSGHPCPKADLDGLLAQTSRSFAALGARLETEAKKATEPHWPAIDREMTGVYRLLADVSTLMRHWST